MSTHEGDLVLGHQFEDLEQQEHAYTFGMWIFLVTEVLFFGGLFMAYLLYRSRDPGTWFEASKELDVRMGGTNTAVLITSSLTMALGVRAATYSKWKQVIGWLVATFACGMGFMVIKFFEYTGKIDHGLFPGSNFHYAGAGDAQHAQIFYSLYFAMTGLHGAHVLIGMLLMIALMIRVYNMRKVRQDYVPIELFGLYWHFVDLVWIFLFPLYYLVNRP